MELTKRKTGLDMVKTLAVILVVSIHAIGQTHILAMDMAGIRAFIVVMFRYTAMACVPLFLLTTGYLQSHKTLDMGFYRGLLPVLASYGFIALISMLYNLLYAGTETNVLSGILHILNFTANNYAWYVEMFIGLFLLIPFLNLMYHAPDTLRKRGTLVAILLALTVAPTVLTVLHSKVYASDILPDFWTMLYPITYYMIGAYLRERAFRAPKLLCLAVALLAAAIPAAVVFVYSAGGEYIEFVMSGFNGFATCVVAVALFLLLYDWNVRFTPVRHVFAAVAG